MINERKKTSRPVTGGDAKIEKFKKKNCTTKLFFANVLLFFRTRHLFEKVNVILGVFSVDFKFKPDNAISYII